MPRPAKSRDRWTIERGIRTLLSTLVILILLSPSTLSAQYEGRVYAITGAKIVTGTGDVIENGTIVLRDGLIEAVGPELLPPPDAIVIEGDSLTVYPGFIDAFSQAGLNMPSGRDREFAGNVADQLSTRYFDADSADLPAYLKQGLTSALVTRDDGVFAGQAVLMNLIGDDVASMTVKAPVVQTLGYQGQRGYPGTLMAVVAYQRQTLIDALYHDMLLNRYQQYPNGMTRPTEDPALEALVPVAKGEAPIMGIVSIENDFKRLRNLAQEYGLKYWIAGGVEAFRVPDLIKEAGVPVLVSMDFPNITEVTGYQFDRAFKNLSKDEKKALDDRDKAAVQGNAAAVLEAGVPLALGTGGMSSPTNFLKNVRLAVAAGLPADEALKALTVTPAGLFGVSDVLGTLEPGKIANLTVTSGDIFTDEDAYVAHVFVDGHKETFEKPKPKGGGGSGMAAGSWSVSLAIMGESAPGTLELTQDGSTVTGTLAVEGQGDELALEGTITGGELELTGSIPDLGSVTLTATIDGDSLTGSLVLGPMGSADITGTRNPGDEATEGRAGQ